MRHMNRATREKSGFSLVELLVAMAVGSIIMALIATAFWSQTQTSKTQQMTVDMQQNIRAALFFIQRDVMMAGYGDDPSNPSSGTITIASPTTLQFTFADPICDEDGIDNNSDGTVDENLEKDGIDNNGDGDIDEINELETVRFTLAGNEIRRALIEDATGAVREEDVIAANIEELEFLYTLNSGVVTDNVATAGDRRRISKVGISILARTEFQASGYTDTQTYHPLSGADWGPYNDHNRRALVTTTVLCRNMVR